METVVGLVIKPVTETYSPGWIWFSRYEEEAEGSGSDCDLAEIPQSFGPGGIYRSIRFRLSVGDAAREQLEAATMEKIGQAGFEASGFLDYPYIDDLASDRFLAEPRTPERMRCRADLMARFLDASAKLFMDALTGPDANGLYHLESIPRMLCASPFSATRHLLCNMTNAPTPVFIDQAGNILPHPSGEVQVVITRNVQS